MSYCKNPLISHLISTRKTAGIEFCEAKLKETFTLIHAAKVSGYLGANRSRSCCLVQQINAANELLRSTIDGKVLKQIATGDEIYIYISLVSLKCFKDVHLAA